MGKQNHIKVQRAGSVLCPACHKNLPRSAFSKASLAGNCIGFCRECVQGVICEGCQQIFPPDKFKDASGTAPLCRSCQGNAQVDRLLQTPKDEVTHFGAWSALLLQREVEYALLLVCYRHNVYERLVLQKILQFMRVPFIISHGGKHYCELCDETFEEMLVKRELRMSTSSKLTTDWLNCPGEHLTFSQGDSYIVAEFRKSSQGCWFFRTQIKTRVLDKGDGISSQRPCFVSYWAPLSATVEYQELSTLSRHLESARHQSLEAMVVKGQQLLVNHEAMRLASVCCERPTTSLSRIRDGLGITDRFCEAADVERAKCLERVRDLEIPPKFLRSMLPGRGGQQIMWITPEEFLEVEEQYRRRTTGRKSCRRDS